MLCAHTAKYAGRGPMPRHRGTTRKLSGKGRQRRRPASSSATVGNGSRNLLPFHPILRTKDSPERTGGILHRVGSRFVPGRGTTRVECCRNMVPGTPHSLPAKALPKEVVYGCSIWAVLAREWFIHSYCAVVRGRDNPPDPTYRLRNETTCKSIPRHEADSQGAAAHDGQETRSQCLRNELSQLT
jgi:hypothetical protein